MKVALCASEVFPFAKTGGLADVVGALPLALEHVGVDSVVFMPRYKEISKEKFQITPITKGISKTKLSPKIDVFLIENEEYYGRDGLYVGAYGDYPDNLDRFKFFSRKVLEYIKDSYLKVDILHCHDWQTALIPVYLKEKFAKDKKLSKIKSMLTLHNLAFQGVFSAGEYPKLELNNRLFNDKIFEFYGKVNLLKAGIVYADKVTTVSRSYAKEILTKEFGCGLEGVLLNRKDGVAGIVNGLDYEIWDPAKDRVLEKTYSPENYMNKGLNKVTLQSKFGLKQEKDTPVFGFVGRLSHQKGVDLILDAIDEMCKMKLQLIIQGIGDGRYHEALVKKSKRYSKQVAIHTDFDERTAHLVYGGSDFFLMPSTYEPCGLSQMISLRYGTVPIVSRTGGLTDTVISFNPNSGKGNGFVFSDYTVSGFLNEIRKAVAVYNDKKNMPRVISNAFLSDFRWDNSAREYIKVYQCLSSG
jgi:starch synthase